MGLGCSARRRRRVAADRGAHPRARAAGDVHRAARQRLEVPRRGAAPKGTVAYFETTRSTRRDPTVSFDASFARGADGTTDGLTYYWDFGDGTPATGKTVSHTYSAAQWADVKLVVAKGADDSTWGVYRQALAVKQPDGLGPVDARLRHVLRGGAQRADHRREGRGCQRRARWQGRRTSHESAQVDARALCGRRFASALARSSLPRWRRGATPMVVSSGGAAADAPPASNPAHPVVDANWIYANDWYNATHFIYKRAGSDGCLPVPASCASRHPGGRQQPAAELQRHAGVQQVVGVTLGTTSTTGRWAGSSRSGTTCSR